MLTKNLSNVTTKFFSTYKDILGHTHYSIQDYNHASGVVTMMKDYKFDDCKYPLSSFESRR